MMDKLFKSLLEGEFSSLYLDYNSHSVDYIDARQFYSNLHYAENITWISDEEKEKALETNSVWTLQVYPLTPIGSYTIAASSLDSLIEYLKNGSFADD